MSTLESMQNISINRRSLLAGSAGLGLVGVLAGCSSDSDSDSGSASGSGSGSAFKIGFIGPLTGDNASYGISASQGAQIAVDEINAAGDVQFELQLEDDVADPETAVNAYNTLMDNGMQVLVGAVTTGSCVSVAAEAYEERVFEITPSASSTDVTADKDNVFQTCFTDPNQGESAAEIISNSFPDAAIAILYRSDDAYSTGIRDGFLSAADSLGLNVVDDSLSFTADTQTDFSSQLTTAQAAGATMIFAPIYYTPLSVLLTQADSMGYDVTVFGCDGADGILAVEGFDSALAEGTILLTPFAADDENNADFVNAYSEEYDATPDQFAADGYDSVNAVKAAIDAAGVTPDMSTEDICEALIAVMPEVTLEGTTGTLTWDASGEVSKEPRAYQIQDGIYVEV